MLEFKRLFSVVFLAGVCTVGCAGESPRGENVVVDSMAGNAAHIPTEEDVREFLRSLPPVAAQAQAEFGTGLEVSDYRRVRLATSMGGSEFPTGLTEERIRTRVELRLRQAGLSPVESGSSEFLQVYVVATRSTFSYDIEFVRPVTYNIDGNHRAMVAAPTWRAGETNGTHGGDAEFVIGRIDVGLDRFLNEYLRSNQP